MNLTGIKNIHVAASAAELPAGSSSESWVPRIRKARRSPEEEFQLRLSSCGAAPEPIPDALAAILMQTQKRVTIQANGIEFLLAGKTTRFWHESSLTCRPENVGQERLITFDQDELDAIYVLSDAGEFVEAIPRADATAWFSPDLAKEIGRYRSVAARVHEGMKRDHALTTRREHDRTKANSQSLQHAVDLPVRGIQPAVGAEAEEAEDFAKARRIRSEIMTMRRMKSDYADRQESISRTRVSAAEMASAVEETVEAAEQVSDREIADLLKTGDEQ
ncbi:MAG: hypothetical protein HY343_00650 [Lentisphaerae bacterium]|nr:hypothetical protein [Lentisphaerota bacterium]